MPLVVVVKNEVVGEVVVKVVDPDVLDSVVVPLVVVVGAVE